MDNDKMPAGLGCNEGLGVLPKRAGHYLPHCYQCQAAILDNDDASVCTKCGGMSLRAYPAHCCPQCGERLGYLGRAFEWFFGRTHNCIAAKIAARFNTTEGALQFEESSYFAFSRSCTVKFGGVWFDVWFDDEYNISNVAQAN